MIQTRIFKRSYHINAIDESKYSKIANQRKEKLDKYNMLKKEGCSEKVILQVIDISRATLFRWKKNYKLYGLIGLEDESRIPNKKRQSTWSKEIENRVYRLRFKYRLWGKAKITIMYIKEYNEIISQSMIGRILHKLTIQNRIKPVRFLLYQKIHKNRVFTGHAQRWKIGMKANIPGELVQFDHMTVEVPGYGRVKNFSAICPITKIAVEKIYKEANSRNAADFLKTVMLELPFSIKSIQVDGVSEFMKDFENLCQKSNIPLFVLPPRSPEYNCNVERANGIFKYEFFAQYEYPGSFDLLQAKLKKFVLFIIVKDPIME